MILLMVAADSISVWQALKNRILSTDSNYLIVCIHYVEPLYRNTAKFYFSFM